MNPMRSLLPFYISKTRDEVIFFGPGYSTKQEIESGLGYFIERHGPFDLEIRTVQSLPPEIIDGIASNFDKNRLTFFKKSFCFQFDLSCLKNFWTGLGQEESTTEKKVMLLHNYDFQAMNSAFKGYLVDNFNLIVGLSEDFWDSHKYESLSISNQYRHTSAWTEILATAGEKVLGLPNFVAAHEFDFNALENRAHDWSIVGTSYNNRQVAKRVLSKHAADFISGRTLSYYSIMMKRRLGLRPLSSRKNLDLFNREFQLTLSASKFSYTCGSDLRMPIRKFFEIPAAGCVLVATPCNGFKELGFAGGVNSIVCEPTELGEVHTFLKKNPTTAQQIAKRGQHLVLNKHTITTRAEQLWHALRLLCNDRYFGSYWDNGDLIFKKSIAE